MAALANTASAHSAVPGIGNFYNGVLHPYLTAPHLIALIACGLLLGQRGLAAAAPGFKALSAGLIAGLLLGGFGAGREADTALLLLTAAAALAVVSAWAVPRWGLVTLMAPLGLLIGLGSAPETLTGSARWVALAGTLIGTLLCAGYLMLGVNALQRPVLRIGVRVLGSWVAAAALLVLALSWVGPR